MLSMAQRRMMMGSAGWWYPAAVRDADFKGNRYWQGMPRVLGDLCATTRASSHLLAGTDGVYRSFGNNLLARVDGVGAFIGGSRTNAHPYSAALTSWNANNGLTVGEDNLIAPDGSLNADTLTQTAATTIHAALQNGFVVVNATPYYFSISVQKVGHRYVQLFLGGVGFTANCYANFDKQSGSFGTIGADIAVEAVDMGDYWRLTGKTTAASNHTSSTIGIILVSGPTAARAESYAGSLANSFGVWGAEFVQSAFAAPHVPTNGAPATRAASIVTATGLGWFAPVAALGATEIVAPVWTHLGDGINRPLFEYVKDANNYIRGYVNASDQPALKIVAGGVTQTDTSLPNAIAKGHKPLAFGWSPAGGYIGDKAGNVVTFGAVTLPSGITADRWGSSQADNYLNDTIARRSTLRYVPQADALAMAAAA